MYKFVLVFMLIAFPLVVAGQDQRGENAQKVASVIRELATRSGKARVFSRKLVVYSGKVVGAYQDSFDLKIKKNILTIKYDDVLELSAGNRDLSFIPETTKRSHGRWEDINKVYGGTKIVVVLGDGKPIRGFSNSATSTKIVIIEHKRHERMEIAREQVVAYYGLIGGYGGVKKGASKGAEAMHSGRDKLLGGIITGIAALAGLVKSDGRPILIYSK